MLWMDDLAGHGRYPSSWVERLGLGWDEFTPEGYELFGDLSLLKAGMVNAHGLLMMGGAISRESLSIERADGLDGLLRSRADSLTTLLPGLDYTRWNPATDVLIPARFDAEQPDGKPHCKADLQHRLGLPVQSDVPLVGLIPPLDDFASSFASVLDRVLRGEVQLVAPRGLASPLDETLNEENEHWQRQVARCDLDERAMHQLLAAADILLLDAPRTPDTEILLAALRYGALPVVRPAGLAQDLVVDISPALDSGNGFLVHGDEPHELSAVLRRALSMRRSASRFGELLRRVMGEPCSWEHTAGQMEQVYSMLLPPE